MRLTTKALRKQHRFDRTVLLSGLVVLMLVPAASAKDQKNAAKPPILVSPKVSAKLEDFRKTSLPGYFALSLDGRASGFSYCRSADSCTDAVAKAAQGFCEETAMGVPCIVYANKSQVLWRGKTIMPDGEDTELARRGWYVLRSTFSWSGRFANAESYMLLPRGRKTYGWFKLTHSLQHGPCYGVFTVLSPSTGRWNLSCGPDLLASGEYLRMGDEWKSQGRDLSGHVVEMIATGE